MWMNDIYALVAARKTDAAIDVLFVAFNQLHSAGKFTESNEALKTIDLTKLDATLLVGLVGITHPAKNKLPARVEVVNAVEVRLKELVGPERAERLLVNRR